MQKAFMVFGTVFAAVLGLSVSQRLSDQAWSVLVGMMCGLSAALPVSAGLVIAWARRWDQERSTIPTGRSPAVQPPVIVLSSPQPQNWMPYQPPANHSYLPAPVLEMPHGERQFKIVGED